MIRNQMQIADIQTGPHERLHIFHTERLVAFRYTDDKGKWLGYGCEVNLAHIEDVIAALVKIRLRMHQQREYQTTRSGAVAWLLNLTSRGRAR